MGNLGEFKCNIGDVNWVYHGGQLVFTKGEYSTMYIVQMNEHREDFEENPTWTVYDIALDKITDDDLKTAFWGGEKLDSVLSTTGTTKEELKKLVNSNNISDLAWIYDIISAYYGWYEFDPSPWDMNTSEMLEFFAGVKGVEDVNDFARGEQ